MYIGVKKVRQQLAEVAAKAAETATGELKEALEQWIEFANLGAATRQRSERLVAAIEAEGATTPELKELLEKKQFLIKRSHWIFGGDGWGIRYRFRWC